MEMLATQDSGSQDLMVMQLGISYNIMYEEVNVHVGISIA